MEKIAAKVQELKKLNPHIQGEDFEELEIQAEWEVYFEEQKNNKNQP